MRHGAVYSRALDPRAGNDWTYLGEATDVSISNERCEECGHDRACHESVVEHEPPTCLQEGCRCSRFVQSGELLED